MMKSKRFVIVLFLFLTRVLVAQDVDVIFQNANLSYQNGQYQEALKAYLQINATDVQSADLFYNIANTYYKLNQIAPSIYYYEKALLTDPNHVDAQHNLVFAQRMTIDAFESLPKSVFQKINDRIIYPIHYNKWAWISVILAFLSSILFLLYYFSTNTMKKRVFFASSILSTILFVLFISFSVKAKHHDASYQPAIVFSQKASIKAEPITNTSEVFQLHEGTKVFIVEQIKDWSKIKLIDGKTGWILNKHIKKIKS